LIYFSALLHPDGKLEEGLPPADLARLAAEPGAAGWLDYEAAAADDLHPLEGLFGFHPLALEDALNQETRPKIEEFETCLFVATRAVNHNRGEAALDLIPLFAFVGRQVIVTVHPRPVPSVATAMDRLRKHPELLRSGPDRLLHHLLDHIVDYYFPLAEELEDRIEALEDRVFTRAEPGLLEEIFDARKEVAVLRRGLGPVREVAANLMGGVPFVDADLRPFFRDVYDHVLRIVEQLEADRDALTGLLESYLSQVSLRMSGTMRQLAVLATIGIPFTLVTGFFGMNFEVMPWLRAPWGVAAAVATMVTLAAGLYLFCRVRRWL
jgi:magnesium transporter